MGNITVQTVPSNTNVTVQDGNNLSVEVVTGNRIVVEVTPLPTQTIQINRGVSGQVGEGVPAGGTTGQVLAKASNTDYDTEWETLGTMSLQNADNVAISGGTAINLTNLQSDYLQLDTAAAASIALGKLRWNAATATAAFGIVDGTDEVNIGEQMFAYVTNAESVAITRGQAVYLYQATGDRATVKLAANTGDATSAKTLGLVAQDSIGANQTGFVITQGQLSKLNMSAFSQGDTLYLGATAGSLTNVKPKAPNHLVYIGVVERANAGNGQMYVRPQNGYELDEIHDVQINSPTTGQTIVWDNATQLWKNSNAVVMNGGSIDNSPIGATTASTGKFTSVTTPSVTATTTDLNLYPTSTGNIYFNQSTSGAFGAVLTRDIGASTQSARLFFDSSSGISSIRNSGGNNLSFGTAAAPATTSGVEQMRVSHTASAVNYVQVTGAATLNTPIISAQGSDSNVTLGLASKGANAINLFTNGTIRQASIVHASSAVNYVTLTGSATNIEPVISVAGTDTNISMGFQSKGTGAIDLAAGSSGVNISNGGTVTAITRTVANVTDYSSAPTVTISVPTTAGGVQATAICTIRTTTIAVANGGTGYTVGDLLTVSGGTSTSAVTMTVATVSGGVITSVTNTNNGTYTVAPTNPVSVTGGTGSGATFNLTGWGINPTFTITNAGSGYIEQPTVSFSGGGGSGAAAYATVGSGTLFKSIGTSLDFYTPNAGVGLRVYDAGGTGTGYWRFAAGYAATASMTTSSTAGNISSGGAGSLNFQTNNLAQTQFVVSHTASAVNYVQVTGSATGANPAISVQGSDATRGLIVATKGSGAVTFASYAGSNIQFAVNGATAGVNYLQVAGNTATNAPILSAQGTDTNIDLALTPKGTGLVRFGTYTAGALTATGYINIKAADGTTYKVLVST